MNDRQINRQIAISNAVIWFCIGFVIGWIPIFGPLILGAIVFEVGVRLKGHSSVRHSSILVVISVAAGLYAAGYLLSGFHKAAFVQVVFFLLAYTGTWCYRWCRTWWKERKVETK